MTILTESNPWEEQFGSERTTPIPSGEEVVLITIGLDRSMAAKILDLSEYGTLVDLTEQSGVYDAIDGECTITFLHQEEIFDIEARVVDRARDLIALQFINPPAEVVNCIRTKVSQMPDWMQ